MWERDSVHQMSKGKRKGVIINVSVSGVLATLHVFLKRLCSEKEKINRVIISK